MSDPRFEGLRQRPTSFRFRRSALSSSAPTWAYVSLVVNGLLAAVVLLVVLRDYMLAGTPLPAAAPKSMLVSAAPSAPSELGPRHQLTYQQWLGLLEQEAAATADRAPQRLAILLGDSLSLWFPPDLLPPEYAWLNQGISGETSAGLRKRLALFDRTQPEVIFVMIGINDLIRRVSDESLLVNQQQILDDLRQQHPDAEIVLQSILPHGGEQATWEGRDRLRAIPNDRIRALNQQLRAIAVSENARYLDLHPLFTDAQGNLRADLSTDGLHLNPKGYLVWRTALLMHDRERQE